jgi:hypothetical protein
LAQSDGHDAPRLIDELVPCRTTMVDEIVVGFEDAVGVPVVAHELPDVLLKADALQVFEPQLLNACVVEANNPQHVPAGELRKIEELDEYGKLKTIRWIGQECFVKEMGRPGRRVVSFRTDQGYVDASGRGLR